MNRSRLLQLAPGLCLANSTVSKFTKLAKAKNFLASSIAFPAMTCKLCYEKFTSLLVFEFRDTGFKSLKNVYVPLLDSEGNVVLKSIIFVHPNIVYENSREGYKYCFGDADNLLSLILLSANWFDMYTNENSIPNSLNYYDTEVEDTVKSLSYIDSIEKEKLQNVDKKKLFEFLKYYIDRIKEYFRDYFYEAFDLWLLCREGYEGYIGNIQDTWFFHNRSIITMFYSDGSSSSYERAICNADEEGRRDELLDVFSDYHYANIRKRFVACLFFTLLYSLNHSCSVIDSIFPDDIEIPIELFYLRQIRDNVLEGFYYATRSKLMFIEKFGFDAKKNKRLCFFGVDYEF